MGPCLTVGRKDRITRGCGSASLQEPCGGANPHGPGVYDSESILSREVHEQNSAAR